MLRVPSVTQTASFLSHPTGMMNAHNKGDETMSHEITGKDTVLLGEGKSAWHGLGIVKEGLLTIDEARRTVAPWEPTLVPVFSNEAGYDPNRLVDLTQLPKLREGLPTAEDVATFLGFDVIPEKVATKRPDTGDVLGILSDEYGLFPNRSGFDLAAAVLDQASDVANVATAGTLRGGRLVWALLKVAEEFDINGDRFDPYLLVRWSHDGSTAVSVDNTVVRVVCKNTWNAAESRATRSWRAKHSGTIEQRAREARQALKLSDAYLDGFDAEVKQLMETVVTNDRFAELVKAEFPIDDELSKRAVKGREAKRERVLDLWHTDNRVGEFQGTGWGAVQAFSTWEEHERRVVGNRSERRALRSISGSPLCDDVREKVLALNG